MLNSIVIRNDGKRQGRCAARWAGAVVALLAALSFCAPAALAQGWNGSASDLWSTASNWTPNTVPNSSTAAVTISNTTNNPVLISGINPTIGALTLGNSTNSLSVQSSQTLTVDGGSISNAGSITLQSSSTLALGSSLTVSGTGTLNVEAGSTISALNGSGCFGCNFTQTGGTTKVAGTISLILPASVDVSGGLLEGTGGIFGNVSISGGTIQGGFSGSPGSLSITELSSLAGGTMLAELGGPGDYDQLGVAGNANLNNGTLDVRLIKGFHPTSPESFDILSSATRTGTFSTVDLPGPGWSVEYGPAPFSNSVVLDFTPTSTVPEPSSVVQLGTAMAMAITQGLRKALGGS